MGGFKFKLESVLKHREQSQLEAQEKFLKEREAYDSIVREVETTREKIIDAHRMIDEGGLEYAHHYQAMEQYRIRLERELKEKENEATKQRNVMKIAKDKLFEATKELKAIEKLREKKFEEYKKEIQSNESKFLDELVSIRSNRVN